MFFQYTKTSYCVSLHRGAYYNNISYRNIIYNIALHNGKNNPRNPSRSINSTTSINHQYYIILQLHIYTQHAHACVQ